MSKQEITPESPERLYTVQELVDAGIVGDPVAGGRSRLLELLGDDVVFDAIGRPCVSEPVAVRLAEEHREEQARQAEEARRLQEEAASRKVAPRGAPGKEGMSAVEAMTSQDPAYSTPAQDYGPVRGNPTRELLDQKLAEGQRDIARKRAESAEKKRIAEVKEKAAKAIRAADKALKP